MKNLGLARYWNQNKKSNKAWRQSIWLASDLTIPLRSTVIFRCITFDVRLIMKSTFNATCITLMIALSSVGISASEILHTFTSREGQAIHASIVSISGDNITIKRKDGRSFTTPISIYKWTHRPTNSGWHARLFIKRNKQLLGLANHLLFQNQNSPTQTKHPNG